MLSHPPEPLLVFVVTLDVGSVRLLLFSEENCRAKKGWRKDYLLHGARASDSWAARRMLAIGLLYSSINTILLSYLMDLATLVAASSGTIIKKLR